MGDTKRFVDFYWCLPEVLAEAVCFPPSGRFELTSELLKPFGVAVDVDPLFLQETDRLVGFIKTKDEHPAVQALFGEGVHEFDVNARIF